MKRCLIFALIVTGLWSCGASKGSASAEQKPGDVIEYEEIHLPCFFIQDLFVINDQHPIDTLAALEKKIPNANCIKNNPLPTIDFERYTLVGFGSAQSGCTRPDIDIKLIRGDKDTIVVEAKITVRGMCDGYAVGKKWVLIPKQDKKTKYVLKSERVFSEG